MRGYHWNIKGVNFLNYTQNLEEIYTDLVEKVDEVAERILTLGLHTTLTVIHNASKTHVLKKS